MCGICPSPVPHPLFNPVRFARFALPSASRALDVTLEWFEPASCAARPMPQVQVNRPESLSLFDSDDLCLVWPALRYEKAIERGDAAPRSLEPRERSTADLCEGDLTITILGLGSPPVAARVREERYRSTSEASAAGAQPREMSRASPAIEEQYGRNCVLTVPGFACQLTWPLHPSSLLGSVPTLTGAGPPMEHSAGL